MTSNDTRRIRNTTIKSKYRNKKLPEFLVPYIGPDFITHSQKNNKPFNTFRNILVLDIGLEDNFNSVDAQALNEGSSFCLKKFINSLSDEIDIKDVVYHCFLATKKIPRHEDPLFKYTVYFVWPVVHDGFILYDEYKLNEENFLDIKNYDLKLSAEILKEIILQAHPDIILVFGNNLEEVIDIAFLQTFKKKFKDYCSKSNVKQLTINPYNWKNPECENDEVEKTMRFLQEEKMHRHNSDFNACLRFVKKLVKDAKSYAQEKKRYTPFFDVDLFHGEKDRQFRVRIATRDNLIGSLNEILDLLSTLNDLKESLIDSDKQRYKPQRGDDDRIGKGRRKRKKEE